MDTPQSGEIMSTRDAAQCLGVSVRTIQLWVESGNLEAWKTPGGHRRIYRQSVDNMLAARSVRALADVHFEVLICSADAGLVRTVAGQLTSIGAELRVRHVDNGFDALLHIGEHCPDLLIIDLAGADTGIGKLLDALQNTPFVRTMHIVALTGEGLATHSRAGGLPPGVTRFAQPVLYPQLLRLVRVYMDIRKAEQAPQ